MPVVILKFRPFVQVHYSNSKCTKSDIKGTTSYGLSEVMDTENLLYNSAYLTANTVMLARRLSRSKILHRMLGFVLKINTNLLHTFLFNRNFAWIFHLRSARQKIQRTTVVWNRKKIKYARTEVVWFNFRVTHY